MKPCFRCANGKPSYELVDAAGIFCTYVCEDCEEEQRAHWDPRIFDERSAYASTGEEEDL